MSRAGVVLTTLVLAVMASGRSDAGDGGIEIRINGVDVTGLVNQKFEGCTVVFDDEGNLDITAPGYTIKKVEDQGDGGPSTKTSQPADISKHYYLWTESKNGNLVGDEYSLIVNGKVVKEFQSSSEQIVEDITPFLEGGTNQVVITAVKSEGYTEGSSSDYFRIVLGQGHEENNKAVIEDTLHKFTRKASDDEPGQSAYTLKAK
jgi:hypothetical protein